MFLVILDLLSALYCLFQHLLCIKSLRSVCLLQVVCSCLSDSSTEPPCVFSFISLTFPCICERGQWQLDWHTVRQAMPFQWWSINPSLRACMRVLIYVCVEKSGGIVRTWPAHFACSSRDRCSWASTGAWQLPFIAVFSTLNPWPALPPSSSSSSSSPLSSLPLSSTSDLFSWHFPRPCWMMDCEGWWAGCALYVVVGCGSLTLSDHGSPAVQTEPNTHTYTHAHRHLYPHHNFLFNSP